MATTYLKLFDNHPQYEEFTETDKFILPNVSHCIEENHVHYNPIRNDMITYRANAKLPHASADSSLGFHAYSFAPATLVSHTFSNGVGKIIFDRDITSIANYAFRGCGGLNYIEIPKTVTRIGIYAFSTCDLYEINIPGGVTTIGQAAFVRNTHLTNLVCPNGLTSIGTHAFEDCTALKSIFIPSTVSYIGEACFQSCTALEEVTIPTSLTTISVQTFVYCSSLKNVIIPNTITTIKERAFEGCRSLTSVHIPNSVTSIENSAFRYCSGITEVTIPNTITWLSNYLFSGCKSLTEVTIPNSVTSMAYGVFENCESLEKITSLPRVAPGIQNSVFKNVKEGGTLYVPSDSTGYNTWMGTGNYYLGLYNWTTENIE